MTPVMATRRNAVRRLEAMRADGVLAQRRVDLGRSRRRNFLLARRDAATFSCMTRSEASAQILAARRLTERRERALAGAGAALQALKRLGVTAEIIGSLADGRFGGTSDIDLLVIDCPRQLKYAIESVVEDCLPGFSFDVLYMDELPPSHAGRYREAVRGVRS